MRVIRVICAIRGLPPVALAEVGELFRLLLLAELLESGIGTER
jgi:hypothetical protein